MLPSKWWWVHISPCILLSLSRIIVNYLFLKTHQRINILFHCFICSTLFFIFHFFLINYLCWNTLWGNSWIGSTFPLCVVNWVLTYIKSLRFSLHKHDSLFVHRCQDSVTAPLSFWAVASLSSWTWQHQWEFWCQSCFYAFFISVFWFTTYWNGFHFQIFVYSPEDFMYVTFLYV